MRDHSFGCAGFQAGSSAHPATMTGLLARWIERGPELVMPASRNFREQHVVEAVSTPEPWELSGTLASLLSTPERAEKSIFPSERPPRLPCGRPPPSGSSAGSTAGCQPSIRGF